jgi:hypothetical protein
VSRATALLYVVDASSPFTKPELDFLIEASKRVNLVVFALTKIDAYPGWRTILADNQGQLQAHAPRFGAAAWFPVSARLAELALTLPKEAAGELVRESRIADLQHALIELGGRGTCCGRPMCCVPSAVSWSAWTCRSVSGWPPRTRTRRRWLGPGRNGPG